MLCGLPKNTCEDPECPFLNASKKSAMIAIRVSLWVAMMVRRDQDKRCRARTHTFAYIQKKHDFCNLRFLFSLRMSCGAIKLTWVSPGPFLYFLVLLLYFFCSTSFLYYFFTSFLLLPLLYFLFSFTSLILLPTFLSLLTFKLTCPCSLRSSHTAGYILIHNRYRPSILHHLLLIE